MDKGIPFEFTQRLRDFSGFDFSRDARPDGRPLQSIWFYGIFEDSSGQRSFYLRQIRYEKSLDKMITDEVVLKILSKDLATEGRDVGNWYRGEVTAVYDPDMGTVTFTPTTQPAAFTIQVRAEGYTVSESSGAGSLSYTFSPFDRVWEWESGEQKLNRSLPGTVTGTVLGSPMTGIASLDAYFGPFSWYEGNIYKEIQEDWVMWLDKHPDGSMDYGFVLIGKGIGVGIVGKKPGQAQLLSSLRRTSRTMSPSGIPAEITIDPLGTFKSVSLMWRLGTWGLELEVGHTPLPPGSTTLGWWEHPLSK